jgi:hypothetical protein
MNTKALKIWEKLLDAYFCAPSISEEWRYHVRRLLFEKSFEEEKFAALEIWFHRMVRYDFDPDDTIVAQFKKIKSGIWKETK